MEKNRIELKEFVEKLEMTVLEGEDAILLEGMSGHKAALLVIIASAAAITADAMVAATTVIATNRIA